MSTNPPPTQRPLICLIAAASRNLAIGCDNRLPWRLPADLKHFKKLTLGHPIIMGRRTWDSLALKPLPGRRNIVLTRQSDFSLSPEYTDVKIAHSLDDAIAMAGDAPEVFVIGGAQIFEQFLDRAERIYLTRIDLEVPNAHAFFPQLAPGDWNQIDKERHNPDDRNEHPYEFVIYDRMRTACRTPRAAPVAGGDAPD